MRLLLINPNTSAHITERLAASARAVLTSTDRLLAVTASNGPAVVRSAADLATANVSAIELGKSRAPGHDAIVLGISLDGAATCLRERHPQMPVVGMTEAALLTACLQSEQIGLLTLGEALLPLYRQRVEQIGIGSRVVAYQAPELGQAFAADRPLVDPLVTTHLLAACERLRLAGARSVVLAGAVLCGYAEVLAQQSGLPVFDGVECAVGQIRTLLQLRSHTSLSPRSAT